MYKNRVLRSISINPIYSSVVKKIFRKKHRPQKWKINQNNNLKSITKKLSKKRQKEKYKRVKMSHKSNDSKKILKKMKKKSSFIRNKISQTEVRLIKIKNQEKMIKMRR
jgi:hypothetical protein